jgi:molybdate transport system substrate-binding protein
MALLGTLVTSCGGDDGDGRTIMVFAASSLTEAFTELGRQYEAGHDGTSIELSFAASSELVTQIDNGAPADAFASADMASMQDVVDAGLGDGEPSVFAHNRLAIAVEPGNPEHIETLGDLAQPDLVVVLCASAVPCGRFADQALEQAGVSVSPQSREASVKATLSKVELGEADAAIVYVTDVRSSGKVDGIDIPDDQNVIATLPIVALTDAGDADLARAWVEYVASPLAEQMLTEEFGFLAP